MLGRLTGVSDSTTPIAVTTADAAARDAYFTKLFVLLDQLSDGHNWDIHSLAGLPPFRIAQLAISGDQSVRYALSELMPFYASGGTFDASLQLLTTPWIAARADFLTQLLELRTKDLPFAYSGTQQNVLFFDVRLDERLSLLNLATAGDAINSGTDAGIQALLANLQYDRMTVFGSDDLAQPDGLAGSAGDDLFFANAGADSIIALGGDDVIEGGDGDDSLDGGAGDDRLADGAGSDILAGGEGSDRYLIGSDSDIDRISDVDGKGSIEVAGELLIGGFRQADGTFASLDGHHSFSFSGDLTEGGTLVVDASLEIENFRDGDLGIYLQGVPDSSKPVTSYTYFGDRDASPGDTIDAYGNWISTGTFAPGGNEFLHGRPGNTKYDTGFYDDLVFDEYDGNDVLILGHGQDFGDGGSGDDWIEGGEYFDWLLGSGGNDFIFAERQGDDIEVFQPLDEASMGMLRMELLSGADGNDTIVGAGSGGYAEGGAGADLIFGGGGNDRIAGDGVFLSTENSARPHSDSLTNQGYIPPVVSTLFGIEAVIGHIDQYLDTDGGASDTIYAGSGNDQVAAGQGDDIVFGGPGNDTIDGGSGNDEIHDAEGINSVSGGAGDDRMYGTGLFGGAGNDTLTGSSSSGEAGDDLLVGGVVPSGLDGGDGADTLIGADGVNDILRGGPGADVLDGGDGANTYFVDEGDLLRIQSIGFAEPSQIVAEASLSAHVIVEFGNAISADRVAVLDFGTSPWYLVAPSTQGLLIFSGALSSWAGLSVNFTDGTRWTNVDLAAHVVSPFEVLASHAPFGTPGDDVLAGTAASERIDGGAGNDQYYITGGGRDSIADAAGTDSVTLAGVRSDEATLFSSGSDLLLRYSGGELRLLGQMSAGNAIESVTFGDDLVTWDRAQLAAHAMALPETQTNPLGVQVIAPGQSFNFVIGNEAFAHEYTIGVSHLEASNFQGGALPDWLIFDAEHQAFSGTPTTADTGVTGILVGLRDESGIVAVTPLIISVEAPTVTRGCGSHTPAPHIAQVPTVAERVSVTKPGFFEYEEIDERFFGRAAEFSKAAPGIESAGGHWLEPDEATWEFGVIAARYGGAESGIDQVLAG
jgi:Ca2+-binding RTX toxin-like protein